MRRKGSHLNTIRRHTPDNTVHQNVSTEHCSALLNCVDSKIEAIQCLITKLKVSNFTYLLLKNHVL